MKKQGLRLYAVFLSAVILLSLMPRHEAMAKVDYMKGIWVATVNGIDYPRTPSREPSVLRAQADEILDKCAELGYNTVFFQVRSVNDAFYRSAIFPFSEFLTGEQGVEPYDDFDPLAYWIWAAHERGLELHAWINPYRITMGKKSLDDLAENNPARIHPEYAFKYSDGKYYYNPALPQVRDLIVDCVNEITDNYDVDGIHLDDYFYPGTQMNDWSDYEAYNTEGLSLDDWRRSNCDKLVLSLSEAVRSKGITFGISPSGIWANRSQNPLGSDTNGRQSYSELYADTRKWAVEGWVDYIAPQIYWEIGHPSADYETLLNWWSDTLRDSETLLYIGIPDYKCVNAQSGDEWDTALVIREQLALNSLNDRVNGEIHFSYRSAIQNPNLQPIIQEYNTVGFIARDDITVILNGEMVDFDVKPVVVQDRTLVPMRAIFESLNLSVDWNGENQMITATSDMGDVIKFKIGRNEMSVNGLFTQLDMAPIVARNRTLVPVRAISEALGASVDWTQSTQTVTITTY